MISEFWKFIQAAPDFLDCEILTKTGTLLTNKCILSLSKLFWPILKQCNQTNIIIILPSHTQSEILEELLGFANKKDILQEKSICESKRGNELFQGGDSENNFDKSIMMKVKNKFTESIQQMPKPPGVQSNVTQGRPNSYQCEHCGKEFLNSKKCRMHRYQVHSVTVYNCEICSASFKTKYILSNHLKVHNEPMFSCEFCQKVRYNIAI